MCLQASSQLLSEVIDSLTMTAVTGLHDPIKIVSSLLLCMLCWSSVPEITILLFIAFYRALAY